MEDPLIGLLPVHFSNALSLDVQIHQFPVLSRSLRIPPSFASTCPSVQARIKPKVGKIEVHVPVDTRPDVWNAETAKVLGTARAEDDRDKNQEVVKGREGGDELMLKEVRMQSERTPPKGAYMLAVVREGTFCLSILSCHVDHFSRSTSPSPYSGDSSTSSHSVILGHSITKEQAF
jgi:DNA-directed RNA polymerase-3 subunit RPC5